MVLGESVRLRDRRCVVSWADGLDRGKGAISLSVQTQILSFCPLPTTNKAKTTKQARGNE